jgi:DNA-binding transcriptional ArsR family regulator
MSRPFSQPDVFAAIADPTRRAILNSLVGGERSVSELAKPFDITLPAVSQHLKILRQTGLVTQTQSGRSRLYKLNPRALAPIVSWIEQYERFWRSKLKSLDRHLKERDE